jgi:hypothetical protein
MDARDLSEQIFKLWQEKYPKDSGNIAKSLQSVPVVVWTEQGYREAISVHINSQGLIQIELDDE